MVTQSHSALRAAKYKIPSPSTFYAFIFIYPQLHRNLQKSFVAVITGLSIVHIFCMTRITGSHSTMAMSRLALVLSHRVMCVLLVTYLWTTTTRQWASGVLVVEGFSAAPRVTNIRPKPKPKSRCVPLLATSDDGNNSENNKNPFNVEDARQQLESMLGGEDDGNSDATSSRTAGEDFFKSLISPFREIELPPPPPVTSMERERRGVEIELLRKLKDSNGATSQLWELWFSERGVQAYKVLQSSDSLMTDPATWQQCEQVLMTLIQQHGVYFCEPVNRLATLYYLQGRYDQSYKLCQVVLRIRPWHFGALSGMVMVCAQLGKRDEARMWADRRLPDLVGAVSPREPFTGGASNPRRGEWVERAVADAQNSIQEAELRTKQSFGKPEDYYKEGSRGRRDESEAGTMKDSEDSAWQ
jgi:hypothetical protein